MSRSCLRVSPSPPRRCVAFTTGDVVLAARRSWSVPPSVDGFSDCIIFNVLIYISGSTTFWLSQPVALRRCDFFALHVTTSISVLLIHRVNWRQSYLLSRYDLHVVGHDVVLCEVNWWRSVTLLLARLMGQYCFACWRLSSSVVCHRRHKKFCYCRGTGTVRRAMLVNSCYVSQGMGVTKVSNRKVTFIQGH